MFLTIITGGIYAITIRKKVKKFKAKSTHIKNTRSKENGNWNGSIISLFFYGVLKYLLTIISLGILNTFFSISCYKYDIEHTIIDGKELTFDGKAKDVFKIRIKRLVFGVLTIGIYLLFNRFKFKRWLCEHTHFK